jgi:hypothetical protein
LTFLPAPLASGGERDDEEDETHEMQERRVQEAVERAHDTFVRLVWSKQAYSSFWSPPHHPGHAGGAAPQRSTKQTASYFRRDPWPLLRAHFVAQMAGMPPVGQCRRAGDAASGDTPREGRVLCLDLEGLWKLLVEEALASSLCRPASRQMLTLTHHVLAVCSTGGGGLLPYRRRRQV